MAYKNITRRTVLAGGLAALFSRPAHAQWWKKNDDSPMLDPQIQQGNDRIGTPLNALEFYATDSKNREQVGQSLEGQYLLVYFGAPHKIPGNSCSIDLGILDITKRNITERYGSAVSDHVTPVFIFPEPNPERDGEPLNVKTYVESSGREVLGLTMPEENFETFAKNFAVRIQKDVNGAIENHTRFTYLMDPEGKNVAIFPADIVPYTLIEDQVIDVMRKDPDIIFSQNINQSLDQ